MANWKYKIKFHDLTDAHRDGSLEINDLCKQLAQRVKEHPLAKEDYEMESFAADFESAANNKELDKEELDVLMEDFYNYADEDNRLYLE